MKDKKKLLLTKIGGVILVAAIITFLGYVFVFEASEGLSLMSLFWLLVPAILIIAILILFLKRLSTGLKKGLPLDDEMSKRIKDRAGYLTLMISIWFMIGLMFYYNFMEELGLPAILARHVVVIAMMFMLVVFGIVWFTLSRRGLK